MIVAIDPGKTGALAYQSNGSIVMAESFRKDSDGNFHDAHLHGMLKALKWRALERGEPIVCIVEHVHHIKGDGAKGSFSFGENFGLIKGLLRGLDIEYNLVSPQAWKRKLGLLKTEKEHAYQYAKACLPNTKLFKKQADAVCLLLYWKGEQDV